MNLYSEGDYEKLSMMKVAALIEKSVNRGGLMEVLSNS